MSRYLLMLAMVLFAMGASADKLPKGAAKARQSVAKVLVYRQGELLGDAQAFFVGDKGDIVAPYSLFFSADSAVVIDGKGVVRKVEGIVGVSDIYDCLKARVAPDKKIKGLQLSASSAAKDESLYVVGYGGDDAFAAEVAVAAVDSVYGDLYYTFKGAMRRENQSLPVVNESGELVAIVQPASLSDTVNSYAVGASALNLFNVSALNYGKGYYPSLGIRTVMPENEDEALSCLYMQAMMGDAGAYKSTIDDFVAAYPKCSEGYIVKAEYEAVVLGNIDSAEKMWEKAEKLADNPAEVYFGKAKVINSIVVAGDSTSHPLLTGANAIAEIDRAIAADNQPLYMSAKADILFSQGEFAAAAECYRSLSSTNMRGADVFAKAAQCYSSMNDYKNSVAMLDSAVNCFDGELVRESAPYILTRALVYAAAGEYRNAVKDYNRYEELLLAAPKADFYYLRSQAEVGAKMYQQALNDLDTAIDFEPQNVAYYIEKALLCYRVKLSDEGIRALEVAKSLNSGAVDIPYLLGRLYMQKGDSAQAKIFLMEAESLGHPDAKNVIQQLK